jgi:predicted permease
LVSGGFFEVLGVGPSIGRLFTVDDDRVAVPNAVISHSFWQRRFGGRSDVLGKTFTLRKEIFTIIGVAARGFIGETAGQQPDFWLPLRMQAAVLPGRDRLHDTPPTKLMWLHVFGRLKPGVTMVQAEDRANAIFHAGLESFYGASTGERRRQFLDQRLQIHSARRGASPARPEFSQSLTALLAAVAVLLLIACANLANLLLARGAARRSEIALRLSLGASRGRLVRQLVTESLTLAMIGAAGAVAVASVLHGVFARMIATSDSDFRMAFVLDPTVMVFVLSITVAATLVFGVFPAWQATKADVGTTLKEQGRGAAGTLRQLRSARVLVALQLALSLPLMISAGLMAQTFYNLRRANLGYPAEHLLLARVDLQEGGYDRARRARVLGALSDEIRRIPGVRAVTFSTLGLFSGGESSETVEVEGFTPKRQEDRDSALDVVGPGYFTALRAPLRIGREILEGDQLDGPKVCVVNEAFAKRFFEGRNPVGMRVTTAGDDRRTDYQVVGVVRNIRTQNLKDAVEPRFFLAAGQHLDALGAPTFLIRTDAKAAPGIDAVRRAVQRAAGSLPILSAATIEDQIAPLTAQDRTTAQLAIAFGSVALVLAAVGLYGVLSYGISRRTGEIAIRIALGAQTRRVVSMIMRETLWLVVFGLAAGGGLADAAARLIDSRLYGVAPEDPLTLIFATGLLVLVAASAAYLPARRASKLDPMAALRQG